MPAPFCKRPPYFIGVTGGMAMGKTAAGRLLKARHIPVFNADQVVHHLLQTHPHVHSVLGKAFPDTLRAGKIDRTLLGQEISGSPSYLSQLESLLHPYVEEAFHRFIHRHQEGRALFAFLEVPLLYELGWDLYCDSVIVMTCSLELQRKRVFQRPGMTQEKFELMQARQLPLEEKIRRADYRVSSDFGMHAMLKDLLQILVKIRSHYARGCARYGNYRTQT